MLCHLQVWDTASGQLKLTLTGHIEQVSVRCIAAKPLISISNPLDKYHIGHVLLARPNILSCS